MEDGVPFEKVVQNLALLKATHIAKEYPGYTVLGFDTLVILDKKALGKPTDRTDAYQMLQSLSGRTHTVLTGCAIVCNDEVETFYDCAEVTFNDMTDKEINEYLNTEEPYDKAGAYGIQEWIGQIGVTKIEGSYFNVMGFPVDLVYKTLINLY